MPIWPLHPSVLSIALSQLKDGVTLDAIQTQNRELYITRGYPEQPYDLMDLPYCWILKSTDMRSIYCQHNHVIGVKVTSPDYVDVDSWLNPESPEYKSKLADAIFHYSTRTAKDDCFEMCIATSKMKDVAWQYAHKS